MNPIAIRASNYRTFQTVELDLPAGCVAILGDNGAGKSSLINVIDLCLFGPDGRSWSPYLTQGGDGIGLELELIFEHGGETYRVRRGWSSAGKGKTTLDFESLVAEHTATSREWLPLSRESIDATQTLLEETIGLTRETFRASSMLVQGDGAAFTEASPRDRKRILATILGLDRFDRYLTFVRRDIRETEGELAGGQAIIQQGEAELERLDEVKRTLAVDQEIVAAATKDLAEAEGWLEASAVTIQKAEEARAQRDRLLQESMTATAKLQPLIDAQVAAETAEMTLAIVREELDTLPTSAQTEELERRKAELEQIVEGYRHAVIRRDLAIKTAETKTAERDAILARAAMLGERSQTAQDSIGKVAGGDLEHCPTCQQELGAESRQATIASLKAQQVELADEIRALHEQADAVEIPSVPPVPRQPSGQEAELSEIDEQITKARQAALQRARLEERIVQLEQAIRSKPAAAELDTLRAHVNDCDERATLIVVVSDDDYARLRGEALRLKARVEEERSRLQQAREDEVRQQTELNRLITVENQIEIHRRAQAEDQARLDVLKILERAYGRDGIPALIVSQAAIPSIELEASRILAELGTGYRVELRTEKALAGGGTADALDVVIVTETGARPYETFSGGERTRLNLALRIGLARLLASRRGAESRLLAIDEPEFLDQAGTAALVQVLRGLTGDFEKVYLVSHVPDLRDAFDQSIEVLKDATGFSQIGGS